MTAIELVLEIRALGADLRVEGDAVMLDDPESRVPPRLRRLARGAVSRDITEAFKVASASASKRVIGLVTSPPPEWAADPRWDGAAGRIWFWRGVRVLGRMVEASHSIESVEDEEQRCVGAINARDLDSLIAIISALEARLPEVPSCQ